MDRHRDVCPFYHTPYLERQLDQEHFEREISSCAHDAGRACILDTLYNGRFDDKRHYPFPPCAVFSAHKRRALLCKEPAYGFRLLGVCADVRPSGLPLEHDNRDGKETFSETVCGTEVGRTRSGAGDFRIWSIRFHKEGHRRLHAAKEPFCLFRL